MKPMDIYSGTAPFRTLKLFMGIGMILITTLLYVVMVGLPALAADWLSYILLPFWAALSGFLCFKLYRSVGFRIEAGHIAVVTGAIVDGYIPPRNIVSVSQDVASQRYRSPKSYFTAKKMISETIVELNTIFSRASSLIGEISGMKLMVELGRQFLRIHLTYMNHACIAYTFFRGDEGLYLSASEGCAIFAINWKQLTKNASDIAIVMSAGVAVLTAALGIALYSLMGVMGLDKFAYFGIVLALMIVLCIKYAYIDPLLSVWFVHTYMRLAEFSEPSRDFFLRLEKMSPAFARMAGLANGKFPTPKKAHTTARPQKRPARRTPPLRQPDARHTLICPRCRSANLPTAKFCAGCGAQLKWK